MLDPGAGIDRQDLGMAGTGQGDGVPPHHQRPERLGPAGVDGGGDVGGGTGRRRRGRGWGVGGLERIGRRVGGRDQPGTLVAPGLAPEQQPQDHHADQDFASHEPVRRAVDGHSSPAPAERKLTGGAILGGVAAMSRSHPPSVHEVFAAAGMASGRDKSPPDAYRNGFTVLA